MKYDPRIEDYHDIKCFASRNNRECLGKFGYFAEDISEFEDLDKCAMGICCFNDGEDFPFYRFEHTPGELTDPKKAYPLFYPVLQDYVGFGEKQKATEIVGEKQGGTEENDKGDFLIKNKPKQLFTLLPNLAQDVYMIETSHKKDSFYSRTQTEQLLICLLLTLVLGGGRFGREKDYYKVSLSFVISNLKACTPQYLDYRGWIEALEFCGFEIYPSLKDIEELSEKWLRLYSESGVRQMVVKSPVSETQVHNFGYSGSHVKFKELREKLGVPREICYPY